MKSLITILFLSIGVIGMGQLIKDTTYFDGCNTTTCKNGSCMTTLLNCEGLEELNELLKHPEYDSLTAHRFITDSLGRTFMIEYRYADATLVVDTWPSHNHYIAICSIILYKANRQQVIATGIKSIYSPVDCSADNGKLWLKRLYEYGNSFKR